MESSNTALRGRNDEAAARELRELREDTLKGLEYALSLGPPAPVVALGDDDADNETLRDAIEVLEERWPA